MTLSSMLISISTFYVGFLIGRARKARRTEASESVAEIANRFYSKGYGAAIKEFGIERRLPVKPRIVGGKDTDSV